MDVLALLRSKNKCLNRFLRVSEKFLIAIEKKDFSDLIAFHRHRDAILKALEFYDRKITDAVNSLDEGSKTESLKDQVRQSIDDKDKIVFKILDVDAKILDRIGLERDQVQKQISEAQKSKDKISKFHSEWADRAGKEMDQKL